MTRVSKKERMAGDRIGKRFVLFFDDGQKVTRREIVIASEDSNFITDTTGQIFLISRIVRMEELKR